MKLLFFNIGWAVKYQGKEPVTGNFRYLKEHDFGWEAYNFKPYKGKVYCYVPHTGGKANRDSKDYIQNKLNISRLDAPKNADSIDGITVIFIAKRKPSDRFALIVGWYKNATVYKLPQTMTGIQRAGKEWDSELGDYWTYYAEANGDDSYCIPPEQRVFEIPSVRTFKDGYGQAPVWYADAKGNKELDKLKADVIKYMQTYETGEKTKSKATPPSPGRIPDFQERKKIEQEAVRVVRNHYEDAGYNVESVEKDGLGWDLTATLLDKELRIEVKGTKGNIPVFELTPNEYEKMKQHRPIYHIGVVTSCLSTPKLYIYEIIEKSECFYGRNILSTEDIDWIKFEEKTAISAIGKPARGIL